MFFSYQKTNAAIQNFGDYASRKIGSIRYFCGINRLTILLFS